MGLQNHKVRDAAGRLVFNLENIALFGLFFKHYVAKGAFRAFNNIMLDERPLVR